MTMTKPLDVVILDDLDGVAAGSPAVARLQEAARVRIFREHLPPAELPAALGTAGALIAFRERTRFDTPLLEALSGRITHIAQTGGGVAHIDLPAATRCGIAVSSTPGGSAPAVAELTLALMLSLAHRVCEGDAAVRAGGWPGLLGTELSGKTLGLVGLGNIGSEVALRARAFGMRVLAWSRHLQPEHAAAQGAQAVPLEQLLAESDYLSVHVRLSEATRGLLSYERLRLVKRGARLINTSRGPIVPEPDLVRALGEGLLGGAGLDVFDQEPLPAGSPLRRLPNVVMMPHVGWTTRETYQRFLDGAVGNLLALAAGRPTNLINPEALGPCG